MVHKSIFVKSIQVGMLQVNCYFIQLFDNSRSIYIIDPGGDPANIIKIIHSMKGNLVGILLTHAHVDHISAVSEIAKEFNVKVFLHHGDKELYFSKENALLPYVKAAENLPEPHSTDELLNHPFEVLHTPGHSPGGVCYYFAESANLFVGDTLFYNSIGRTDLKGGNFDTLLESIKTKLFSLPKNVKVYSGHGPETTIEAEKNDNPFLKDFNLSN